MIVDIILTAVFGIAIAYAFVFIKKLNMQN